VYKQTKSGKGLSALTHPGQEHNGADLSIGRRQICYCRGI